MLFTYVYTSLATEPSELNPDLVRILRASRRRNPGLGITGVLLYVDGIFAQCIEGPADVVAGLAHRIETDPAHGFIDVLRAQACSARCFADWDMGFHSPCRADDKRSMAKILRSRDRSAIMGLLHRVSEGALLREQTRGQGFGGYRPQQGYAGRSQAGFS